MWVNLIYFCCVHSDYSSLLVFMSVRWDSVLHIGPTLFFRFQFYYGTIKKVASTSLQNEEHRDVQLCYTSVSMWPGLGGGHLVRGELSRIGEWHDESSKQLSAAHLILQEVWWWRVWGRNHIIPTQKTICAGFACLSMIPCWVISSCLGGPGVTARHWLFVR